MSPTSRTGHCRVVQAGSHPSIQPGNAPVAHNSAPTMRPIAPRRTQALALALAQALATLAQR